MARSVAAANMLRLIVMTERSRKMFGFSLKKLKNIDAVRAPL